LNIAYNLIEHVFTFKFQKQSINREEEGGANLGALFQWGGWCWRLRPARSMEEVVTRPIEEANGDPVGRSQQRLDR
jgi:hypothetical protein